MRHLVASVHRSRKSRLSHTRCEVDRVSHASRRDKQSLGVECLAAREREYEHTVAMNDRYRSRTELDGRTHLVLFLLHDEFGAVHDGHHATEALGALSEFETVVTADDNE